MKEQKDLQAKQEALKKGTKPADGEKRRRSEAGGERRFQDRTPADRRAARRAEA